MKKADKALASLKEARGGSLPVRYQFDDDDIFYEGEEDKIGAEARRILSKDLGLKAKLPNYYFESSTGKSLLISAEYSEFKDGDSVVEGDKLGFTEILIGFFDSSIKEHTKNFSKPSEVDYFDSRDPFFLASVNVDIMVKLVERFDDDEDDFTWMITGGEFKEKDLMKDLDKGLKSSKHAFIKDNGIKSLKDIVKWSKGK